MNAVPAEYRNNVAPHGRGHVHRADAPRLKRALGGCKEVCLPGRRGPGLGHRAVAVAVDDLSRTFGPDPPVACRDRPVPSVLPGLAALAVLHLHGVARIRKGVALPKIFRPVRNQAVHHLARAPIPASPLRDVTPRVVGSLAAALPAGRFPRPVICRFQL
ncbi:MAG: hypothetical protein ACXW32_12040 [Limisphaerales bacterium]